MFRQDVMIKVLVLGVAILLLLPVIAVPAFSDEGEIRNVSSPVCSADGTTIYFSTDVFAGPGGRDDIWSISSDGTAFTQITNTTTEGEEQPEISPNGQYLAYVKTVEGVLRVVVSSSGGANPASINAESISIASSPFWFPDSNRLVYSANGDLLLVLRTGQEQEYLAAKNDIELNPCISSDGNWIVYDKSAAICPVCENTGGYCSQIWTAALSTKQSPIQLSTGHYKDKHPRFSPDMTKIVFESDRYSVFGQTSSIYIMNSNGTGLQRVPISGGGKAPSWMPNGKILFVLGELDEHAQNTYWNIATIQPNGSDLTYVTNTVAAPALDPDEGYPTTFPQEISMTCSTANATIRYTTDGSEPTTSSTVYTTPFTINGATTIRAKAWKAGSLPSLITRIEYEE